MALTNEKIEHIRALCKNGKNDSEIAKIVDVSRNTVRKYKTDEETKRVNKREQREQIVNRYKKEEERIVNKWLDKLHQDSRLQEISDRILDKINTDEVIDNEMQKNNGLYTLVGTLKTIVDIASKIKDLNIKERKEDRESIMQSNEIMNDNFENAIVDWVEKHDDVDIMSLVEPDSIGATA